MAYIYCITNLVNGKLYIGKTTYSITKRFLEHCADSLKERCSKRPLYDAMNKYGIENFVAERLLECDELELDSYELLFIEKFDTYHNGYNATKGGDGKILFDYKEIVELYRSGLNIRQVASKVKCCVDTVRKVLDTYNIKRHEYLTGSCQLRKLVTLIDVNTLQEILVFQSIADAAHWLVDNGYAKTYNGGVRLKISLCVQGKLKTAYKFIWK